MLNIIMADLYRIFRSKGFYINVALMLLYIIIMGFVNIVPIDRITPSIIMATNEILQCFFLLAFIIFICSADFSSGTAKNVISHGISRIKYYFAKLILSCIFCFVALLSGVILSVVMAVIFSDFGGIIFSVEFFEHLMQAFYAQLFICVAITCIGVFCAFSTKNTAAVIGAYLAFYFIPPFIIQILINLNEDFRILYNYDLGTNIRMLANIDTTSQTDIIRAFVIGGSYMLLSTIGGIVIFKNSEI